MNLYKCTKGLVVPELIGYEDEQTGNDFVVEVGEVWTKEEGESLLSQENGRWLDIDEETLEEHFEKVEENL